jgi:hypothetical protein
LAGERHNDWSRRVVAKLSGARWPIGDGMVGCVVEPGDGPGRTLSLRAPAVAADRCLTGGPITDEESALVRATGIIGDPMIAADRLGAWWPGCGLAGLEWRTDSNVELCEVEADRRESAWLGEFFSSTSDHGSPTAS